MRLAAKAAALVLASGVLASAMAANAPCSGRKGGIAGCRGTTFICNDGSVSASRKSCPGYTGSMGFMGMPAMTPAPTGECSCRSGVFCTGPRGGKYCLTDSGGKSYLKQ